MKWLRNSTPSAASASICGVRANGWPKADRQSARLMALYFQNLSKGMGKADALRAAKLRVIEERREDFAAAHPFFWAAFTLTGEP